MKSVKHELTKWGLVWRLLVIGAVYVLLPLAIIGGIILAAHKYDAAHPYDVIQSVDFDPNTACQGPTKIFGDSVISQTIGNKVDSERSRYNSDSKSCYALYSVVNTLQHSQSTLIYSININSMEFKEILDCVWNAGGVICSDREEGFNPADVSQHIEKYMGSAPN